MDILEKWLTTHSSLDTDDIPLYDIVAEEIEAGVLHKGTWAKAFAEANADKDKARAIYLKLRVAQLPTEIAAFQAAAAESNRPSLSRLQDLARGSLPDMDHVGPICRSRPPRISELGTYSRPPPTISHR